jgi:hypothetical protein
MLWRVSRDWAGVGAGSADLSIGTRPGAFSFHLQAAFLVTSASVWIKTEP